MQSYDVVVIGAGPAGACYARLAAENGYNVLMLERQEYAGKITACGGLLSKKHFDHFVDDKAVVEQPVSRIDFVFPWGSVAHEEEFVTVQRCIFDRYLAENAARKGVTLLTSTTATDYEIIKPGEVVVHTKSKERGKESYQCKLVVFGDGPFSMAAKKNPRFDPEPKKPWWAFAYAYDFEGVTVEPDVCKIYLDERLVRWGYAWIFPDNGMMNVGIGTILPEMKNKEDLKKAFKVMIEEHPETAPLLKNQKILKKNGGYIPMRLLDEYCDDSEALIGDAAGMVSPLFGAGIDYCMEAAMNLAEVTDMAFKEGRYDREFLNQYTDKMEAGFFKDLKHQNYASDIIIKSMKFHSSLPTKLLSIAAFGGEYNRFNKVRTLLYPMLGTPTKMESAQGVTFTHGTRDGDSEFE